MKKFWNNLFPYSEKRKKEAVEEKEVSASDIETLLKDKELFCESSLTSKMMKGVVVNGYKGPLTENSPEKRSKFIADITYGPFKRTFKRFSPEENGMSLCLLEISNEDPTSLLQVKATIQWYEIK